MKRVGILSVALLFAMLSGIGFNANVQYHTVVEITRAATS